MIIKYLPIAIIASALALVSCSKEAQQAGTNAPATAKHSGSIASIAGKWQETKVVTYIEDPAGNKLSDTTYLSPFTAADYALFNNDGSCAVSIDHYYFPNGPGISVPQAIPQLVSNYVYAAAGSNFVMRPQINVQSPGGGSVTNTVSMPDDNTLLIHTV
ncbi:MAG: hypothetical protein ACXVIY_13980, partial [Mucilaginibacter sp.]